MNRYLLVASLLGFFTFGVHAIMGGIDTTVPLLSSAIDKEPKLTLYAVWHMVSVFLFISSVAVFYAAKKNSARELVLFVGVCYTLFAAVFLLVGIFEAGSIILLPQWILLFPIGALCIVGSKKAIQSEL